MEVILHLFFFSIDVFSWGRVCLFVCSLSQEFSIPVNSRHHFRQIPLGFFKTSERLSNRIRSNRNKTNGAKFNTLSLTVFNMFLSDISAEIGTQSVLRSRSVPKTKLLSRSKMSDDYFFLFVCFSQDVVSFVIDYLHYQVSP